MQLSAACASVALQAWLLLCAHPRRCTPHPEDLLCTSQLACSSILHWVSCLHIRPGLDCIVLLDNAFQTRVSWNGA